MQDRTAPLPPSPVVGIGIVIWNEYDEFVLIRRGKPPRQGEWSIPGGRLEWGETLRDGAMREAMEETGLKIEILGFIDIVDSVTRNDSGIPVRHYVLADFAARAVAGSLRAGSDAADARWVPFGELERLALWSETQRIIRESRRYLAAAKA